MKKLIITAIVLLSMAGLCKAQDYTTSIGLRGGFSNGLTVKHFISEQTALEAIVASRWKGTSITGLYEIHAPAFDTYGLTWYYGGGAHIGLWDSNNVDWDGSNGSFMVLGFDGVVGLEYTFADFPINVSIDWKPAFNVLGHQGFWGDNGALSIRYIFH